MGAKNYERVRVTTATAGTGTVTLGSAVSSFFQSFSGAGVADGETVDYVIRDLGTGKRERGTGVYTASGTTLSRTVITSDDGAATALTLSGNAVVSIVQASADVFNALATSSTIGGSDVAAPPSVSLSVPSVVAGTTNTAGADWIRKGSKGTGSAGGGRHIWQTTYSGGGSGSTQGTLQQTFAVNTEKSVTIGPDTNFGIKLSVTGSNALTILGGGGSTATLNASQFAGTTLSITNINTDPTVGTTWTKGQVLAGNANTSGAGLVLQMGGSTGSHDGGDLDIQSTPKGSSGSAQNAYVSLLKIKGNGYLVRRVTTFASLPSAATAGAGATAMINDSPTAASGNYGATVSAGGGGNFNKLVSDGTNWTIG